MILMLIRVVNSSDDSFCTFASVWQGRNILVCLPSLRSITFWVRGAFPSVLLNPMVRRLLGISADFLLDEFSNHTSGLVRHFERREVAYRF